MRFEDPDMVNTFSCLHHQEPAKFLSVVFQNKSHTTNLYAFSALKPTKRTLP